MGHDLKRDWSLLPWRALGSVVDVLTWSESQKHSDGSWRTKSVSHHFGKMVGHAAAHVTGEPTDMESGLPALAHAAARALMCLGVYLDSEE